MKAIYVFDRVEFQPGERPEWPLDLIHPANPQQNSASRFVNDSFQTVKGEDYIAVPLHIDESEDLNKYAEMLLCHAADNIEKKRRKKSAKVVDIGNRRICVASECVLAHKDGKYGMAVLDNTMVWDTENN